MDKWLCDGCQSKYLDCDEANDTKDGRFLCETCWESYCEDEGLCLCGQPAATNYKKCGECMADEHADYVSDRAMDR